MKLPLERESDGDNLYDADGDLIAFVFSGGNAGSILTAVNSHEMLVEALKMGLEIGDQCSRGFLGKFQEKARKALAQLEEVK